jgi:hypothetical protein
LLCLLLHGASKLQKEFDKAHGYAVPEGRMACAEFVSRHQV